MVPLQELANSAKDQRVELQDKVAIVTGGGVRLGRAIALALASAGVKICLHHGHSEAEAEATADEIRAQGGSVTTIQPDLLNSADAAQAIITKARSSFGHIDFLVNNAAIFEEGTLATTTETDWDRHFAINLKSPFFLIQAFAAELDSGQRAHIVNIADWRGLKPGTEHLAYTLTKAGLITLTHSLAQELAPDVQVNAIAPGAILAPPDQPPTYLEELSKRVPLRRTGNVGEITDALLFLLRSDFITGEVVRITGGQDL